MITLGVPGKLAPYTFISGVVICISYQMLGRESSRWGSLQRMGAPLFVFAPLTAQLLLPLLRLTRPISSDMMMVESLSKYSESAFSGLTGRIPGDAKKLPGGIMGCKESGTCGNN